MNEKLESHHLAEIESDAVLLLTRDGFRGAAERYIKASAQLRVKLMLAESDERIAGALAMGDIPNLNLGGADV